MNTLQAVELEKCVVGSILRNISAVKRISKLTPDDFTSIDCRRAFAAGCEIARDSAKIDILVLADRIDAKYGAGAASLEFLTDCMTSVPTSVNAGEYAKAVLEASARRKLTALADKMRALAADKTQDVGATISEAQGSLRGMLDADEGWEPIGDVMLSAYEDCELRTKGERRPTVTGIEPLDRLTGGIWPGELTIIGARPAVGKSAFAMQLAVNAALLGEKKVCFASAEMVDVQMGQRLIAKTSRLNAQRLRRSDITDGEFSTMASAINVYGQLPVSFLFSSKYVEDICAETERKHDLGECEVLVVDYLQLLRTRQKFKEDRLRVAHISQMLKALTTDLKIPVIALAQVRRQNNNGRARCPALDDLRDSGTIEQDADNVVFLHRPDGDDDQTIRPDDLALFRRVQRDGREQYIVLNVAKQRQGEVGMTAVLFDGARMDYRPITNAERARA